jgi:hypothetical protein
MQKSKGGGDTSTGRTAAPSEFRKAVEAAGLSEDQAKRWQQLAGVSEKDFEAALAGPKKPSRGKIISTSKSKAKPEKKPKRPPMDEDTYPSANALSLFSISRLAEILLPNRKLSRVMRLAGSRQAASKYCFSSGRFISLIAPSYESLP